MLNNKISATFLSLTIFLLSICSCEKPGQIVGKEELALKVPITELSRAEGNQFIRLTAPGAWSLSFQFEDEIEPWASLSMTSGEGSQSGITLSWTKNAGDAVRTFILTLKSEGKEISVFFKQASLGGSTSADGTIVTNVLKSDNPGKWMELPATNDPDLYFITHARSGSKARNWSYYYDIEAKTAVWVAYPINERLIASGSRTNKWGLDPKVPEKHQPILYGAYRGGYNRGHQLPSADRLKYAENISTFYFTNMTPQSGDLNSNEWATLEGKVREWCRQMDTLYVVTGANLKGSTRYATDNVGARIPVPAGYFKALLGYKKGGAIGNLTGGYIGVAFYFDHQNWSSYWNESMTIDELEEKLGYDFFVNLPDAIGKDAADKVESSIDNWWKK